MGRSYPTQFYADYRESSRRSARSVVPLVMELVAPRSVADLGCGTGTWLSVFRECGCDDVTGVDGAHVDPDTLEIPRERFIAHDLAAPLALGRTFDLAMSLEAAEHLPGPAARGFVRSIASLAPVVLFSAAIPGQGGLHHVNEQWPPYWIRLFADAGYEAIDCLRALLWDNERISWWYAQNMLLFCQRERLNEYPKLVIRRGPSIVSLVHPKAWEEAVELRRRPPRELLGATLRSCIDRIRRKFTRRA